MTGFRMRRWFRRHNTLLAVVTGVLLASAVAHGVAHDAGAPARAAVACATASAVTCGEDMAAERGWTGSQWSCLDALWTRESGWNPYAANPASSARGIPQDINGWSDYSPGDVPNQVRWGLGYIAGRYITPCAAWQHETQQGWY